tara:strand:- start:215 stop:334 length:120 start_codon:yes stop_codon:yes gene_type:complete
MKKNNYSQKGSQLSRRNFIKKAAAANEYFHYKYRKGWEL